MMEGLGAKKYMHTSRKRFDPISLVISIVGIAAVVASVQGVNDLDNLIDVRSFSIVIGGTIATLLFQYDFSSFYSSLVVILRSFMGTPERKILSVLKQLDDTIINGGSLGDLREGSEVNGEILNDVVYMYNQGLLFEEIDEFITSRIADEFSERGVAVSLLNKAAVVAPALGLFGTVMGLIGVLKSLSHPGQIGPSMSLALMTTAYGAGIGSLIFSPLAGRLEHHNEVFLEVYKQMLSKISILLNREDRRMDRVHSPTLEVS
jgi:chemotaxis protein MotA